jgi:hypothetical protein
MKKESFDYSDVDELLFGRKVSIGLKSNFTLSGVVKYVDEEVLVLVVEPTSNLDIETEVSHTIVDRDDVAYIQFKTEKSK